MNKQSMSQYVPKNIIALLWHIAMASGWESEVCGFEPQHLHATFDPGLPQNYT